MSADGKCPLVEVRLYSQASANGRPLWVDTSPIDRGQTREICEKQENNFKGKVVTPTIQSLMHKQYPADLLTFLELY